MARLFGKSFVGEFLATGYYMRVRLFVLVGIFSSAFLSIVPSASAEMLIPVSTSPLFDGSPTSNDVQGWRMSGTYTVSDVANKIGKLYITGQADDYFPTGTYNSNPIPLTSQANSFSLTAYFDLASGELIGDNPGNSLLVTGTGVTTSIGSSSTLFSSSSILQMGVGGQGVYTFIFGTNSGIVSTGADPKVYVSLSSLYQGSSGTTSTNPYFQVTGSSLVANQTIWRTATSFGSANAWAPAPATASSGLVLLALLGGFRFWRRQARAVP